MTPSAVGGDRRPLTVDRIIDSAILLAKAEGMAGVSMRKVARRLGVEPMSLYHHVPSKAALMLLMADRSIDQLPEPDPASSWDEQLVQLLMDTYHAAIAKPAIFPVLAAEPLHPDSLPVTRRDDGGASLGLLERVLTLLAAGDVPAADQVHAFRGLIGVLVGFVVGQVDGLLPAATAPGTAPVVADEGQRHRRAPLLTQLRPTLTATPAAQGLRFTLILLVRGLSALPEGRDLAD
jgi:TetR/AcrR family tetracycline transcriptional repressor